MSYLMNLLGTWLTLLCIVLNNKKDDEIKNIFALSVTTFWVFRLVWLGGGSQVCTSKGFVM